MNKRKLKKKLKKEEIKKQNDYLYGRSKDVFILKFPPREVSESVEGPVIN